MLDTHTPIQFVKGVGPKKAEALALALGSKIGKPLFIEEELIRYPVSGSNFSNSIITEEGGAGAGNASLAPG